ncbi:MAG TPA: hypothetical protein VIR63_05375 [Pontiella sp.]
MKTGTTLSVCTLLFCFSYLSSSAETYLLDIAGTAVGADGQQIAYARQHGIIQQGDILEISTEHSDFKLKIMEISPDGVQTEQFDLIPKGTIPLSSKEQSSQNPGKIKETNRRDPFLPIEYKPSLKHIHTCPHC